MAEVNSELDYVLVRPDVPPPESWVPLLEASYSARQFSNNGPLVRMLMDTLELNYCAPGYRVLPVANATAGITASLQACLPPGAGVIVPNFTFPATMQAILMAGGVPVLADVSQESWGLDSEAIAPAVKLAAEHGVVVGGVLPVRPFGSLTALDSLFAASQSLGLWTVVDAAAALPSPTDQYAFGSPSGEIEIVSLHATKAAGIGEGGLVFVPEERLGAVGSCMNFGLSVTDSHFQNGLNAKMDEFTAARVLAQQGFLEGIVRRRSALARRYEVALGNYRDIQTLPKPPGPHAWSLYPILLGSSAVRARFEHNLATRRVASRRYYFPTLSQGYRGGFRTITQSTPVADLLAERILCVPVLSNLDENQEVDLVSRVEGALEDALAAGEG